jgi:hypothetical protein
VIPPICARTCLIQELSIPLLAWKNPQRRPSVRPQQQRPTTISADSKTIAF